MKALTIATPTCSTQIAESSSTATLTNEVNKMVLNEDISSKVSAETLSLINEADKEKSVIPPAKRVRTNEAEAGPSNDPGLNYPPVTKPIYLKNKALLRKKLNIATKLSAMKKFYGVKDPTYTAFRCPTSDEKS